MSAVVFPLLLEQSLNSGESKAHGHVAQRFATPWHPAHIQSFCTCVFLSPCILDYVASTSTSFTAHHLSTTLFRDLCWDILWVPGTHLFNMSLASNFPNPPIFLGASLNAALRNASFGWNPKLSVWVSLASTLAGQYQRHSLKGIS